MRGGPAARGLGLLLSAAVAGACSLSRATPEMRYYTLAVPVAGAPLGAPLRIGRFTADLPYAGSRLAYRTSPYRLDYYNYHRWAASPPALIAGVVRDHLEAAAGDGGAAPVDVVGHVRRLEEVDEADGWKAALTLALRATRGGTLLVEGVYAEEEPAAERTPEAVAAAASRALGRALDRFRADLTRALAASR